MEQLVTALVGELFKYGLPGLFIVYLIIKIMRMETAADNKDIAHKAEIKAKDDKINGLQDLRVTEAIKSLTTVAGNTGAIEHAALSVDKLAEAQGEGNGLLKEIGNALDELLQRKGRR